MQLRRKANLEEHKMSLPKRKNDIQIYQGHELVERRQEMLDEITKHDTYLPESLLHDDLDLGMLNFVKENLKVISDGNEIPIYERILTIQRWGEMSANWTFTDGDNNIKLPFIAVIRKPDPQPGSNPVLQRTIPDRHEFHYQTVKTWNGSMIGADVYKMPQPVAVDISFEVNIVCQRIRDLNRFNKMVLQKFSSRQSYTRVKGHYIPIILERINDNSPIDNMDGRRFYTQKYEFTMLGFLIDDEEFEVKPAISRALLIYEIMGTPLNRTYIDKSVRITIVNYTGNSQQTLYSVGEPIGTLFYVAINGDLQRKDVDYFHLGGTSNITFATAPLTGDDIIIAYYPKKERYLVNSYGNIVNLSHEYFTYDGTTMVFETNHPIDSVVYVEINGLVDIEGEAYNITASNEITLLVEPLLGSTIGVTYFY